MQKDLTTGSAFKNVLYFSLPYLLSYFLQTLYGMADLFIIGQFEGTASITAVSIGSQIMHMITVMLVGLAMGVTVGIGRAVGAHDDRGAGAVIGNAVMLFLAVSAVMILLLRDRKNTSEHELQQMEREETAVQGRSDLILKQVAWVLLPFIFLFAIYVLLNGETSPGGGFSGGTILGAGLILFSAAFGPGHTRVLMNQRRYSAVRTFGLLLYAVLYGVYIFIGANGLPNYLTGMILLIDLAVGLVVACTVYGFYALFSRGEI